jgi:Ni,Fe-hydrogenase III large subunit
VTSAPIEVAGDPYRSVEVGPADLVDTASELFAAGYRLALVAGHDDSLDPVGPDDSVGPDGAGGATGGPRVVYLFTTGPPDRRVEVQVRLGRDRPELPSLAGLSFPASRFERELRDLFGIEPVGHPLPRRLVLHQHWPTGWHPLRRDAGPRPAMIAGADPYPFAPVEGPGVYEIPVGPVHAGLIEPGHFRFWVVGETILKMKARLWFIHKGIERLFQGRGIAGGMELAERISGDSAVGHGLAYCLAVEAAAGVEVPGRAGELRSALLEMERLYNHVADVGALCNDVGFGLANARALILRERLLRLNAEVTGHRLLRGGVLPGGAAVRRLPALGELREIGEQFDELVDLALSHSMVIDRFAGMARLGEVQAAEIGVLGVVGRASGRSFDARVAHPFTEYPEGFHPAVRDGGDVLARFRVRADEVVASLTLINDVVGRDGPLSAVAAVDDAGHASAHGTGIAEGWRGAIVHRVELDSSGRLGRVKVVDPSFLNWPALAVSLADTIVPDFPLANKSFNLSYAGNDL